MNELFILSIISITASIIFILFTLYVVKKKIYEIQRIILELNTEKENIEVINYMQTATINDLKYQILSK